MLSVDTTAGEDVSVLHVEGDTQARQAVDQFLRLELDEVTTTGATDRETVREHVEDGTINCVISAYDSSSVDGLEILRSVRAADEQLPFVLFADVHDETAAIKALNEGADAYLYRTSRTQRYVRLAQRIESLVASQRRADSLAQTVRDFSRLFNRTKDVFWMYTADWEDIVFINSSYENVWGQPLSRLQEDPMAFLDAVHPEDRARVQSAMERLSDGSPVEIEFRVNPEESFDRWVWVHGTPITDSNARVEYLAGYVRDITERRERKRELERRAEQLERQAEQREFFNSVLRHDVLNGMNVIRGRSEYLVDELEAEGPVEQAETIREWADEISEVIDHIRAVLQTIQDGEGQNLYPVSLRPVVREEAERVAAAYPETNFETDVPEGLTVRANDLLNTVINNLLTNAVEHNDPTGLTVTVTAVDEGPLAQCRVADTGQGIPDDRKEAVFTRGESTRRANRGGLGLFLVETLVTTYGGAVWIEDNEPTGTVVRLDLPTA